MGGAGAGRASPHPGRFDDKEIEAAHRKLLQAVDERGAFFGKGDHYARCRKHLVDLMGTFRRWEQESV